MMVEIYRNSNPTNITIEMIYYYFCYVIQDAIDSHSTEMIVVPRDIL